MIRGIHGLLYSSDPEATRAFFRDVVKLPGSDIGDGWWIFDFAEGDLGVHPVDDPSEAGTHDVSLYCDDIHATVADLRSRGVKLEADVEDRGYGLVTYLTAPGGIEIQLYEPRYVKGIARTRQQPAKRATRKASAKAARRGAPRRPAAKKKR